MIESLTINNKNSYTDFNLYISKKEIGLPNKKIITQDIPFKNGHYDFSNYLGYPTYDNRTISYTFDIVADDLENEKSKILNWLFNVNNDEIYDSEISDYHFKGSFSDYSYAEDENYAELTVIFDCYPFKIANNLTSKTLSNETNIIEETDNTIPIFYELKSINGVQSATIINDNTQQVVSLNSNVFTKINKPMFKTITIELEENVSIIMQYRKEVY